MCSQAFFVSYDYSKNSFKFQHVLVDRERGVADPKDFVSTNVGDPKGIAVDWSSRLVYWTNYASGQSSIQVSRIPGVYRHSLKQNLWGQPDLVHGQQALAGTLKSFYCGRS